MGDDRRQNDRRQSDRRQNSEDRRGERIEFQDRRQSTQPANEAHKKQPLTVSFKTFIIVISIVLIIIIGMLWFTIHRVTSEINNINSDDDYQFYDEGYDITDEDSLYNETILNNEFDGETQTQQDTNVTTEATPDQSNNT